MDKNINFKVKTTGTKQAEGQIDKLQNKTVSAGKSMAESFRKVGAALGLAFGASMFTRIIGDLQELGNKIIGVEKAFNRLNDPNLLSNLRKATKGTIDDLQLMQSATFAEKMRIPMDVLIKGMEFAGLTAIETGQDINYMMESFVTGTARQSIMILDNLGISSKELSEEIEKTGDFMIALGNIMDRQLAKMREGMDDTILKTQQLNTELENHRQVISVGIAKAWNEALDKLTLYFGRGLKGMGALAEFIGTFLTEGVGSLPAAFEKLSLEIARISGITKDMNNDMEMNRNIHSLIQNKLKENKEITEETTELIKTQTQELEKQYKLSIEPRPLRKMMTPSGRVASVDRTLHEQYMYGKLEEEFQEKMKFINSLVYSSANLLRHEFINAWEDIFGEANSLFEKFMQNVVDQLAQLAAQNLATSFLSFIPGIGTIAAGVASIVGGGSGGGDAPVILRLGDEDVATFVRKGNEYNRVHRLN